MQNCANLRSDFSYHNMTKLVKNSKTFIRRLPWAKGATENNGQGPFEKEDFDPLDFASIHSKNQEVLMLPSC